MDLSNLTPAEGSNKSNKRLGRGQGSGKGGTSGRGHKGSKQHASWSRKKGFEGGQNPIQRRVPKFGFKNINRVEYKAINLGDLEFVATKFNTTTITPEIIQAAGLIGNREIVKVLAKGTLTKKLEVRAHAFSESAIKAIESQQGTVITL